MKEEIVMKLSTLIGNRYKEVPSDIGVASHAMLLRGGYIRPVSNGIFSLYMPAKLIAQKIEAIIRKEMNSIDGQEVSMPVVMPRTMWEESGRYNTIGSEMVRFKDRTGSDMVLGMTHEEAAVQLVKDVASTYKNFPFMIYQFQTKFRDEARSRGGLIRVREFVMKDAYSFHTSLEDLTEYYKRCHLAYERIFATAGLPEVVSVESDSGMMGGSVSHEFMLLCDAGEDTIVICTECDYRANIEATTCIIENNDIEGSYEEISEVYTPNVSDIESVAAFLKVSTSMVCKAVVYEMEKIEGLAVVFIRGDLEVNEAKLRNIIGSDIFVARPEEAAKVFENGFIGPRSIAKGVKVYIDESLKGIKSLIAGSGKKDYHIKGYSFDRDYNMPAYVNVAKPFTGSICPNCKKPSVKLSKGIEVGNIFQLGQKYTKAMDMTYMDLTGELQYPIMGCYGVGVGRLIGSICEVKHDEYGPIWPITVTPWKVHICVVRADMENVKAVSDSLYSQLNQLGVEVIIDDRSLRAGAMFADADLLGVPIRVIVSPKNLENGKVEVVTRDKKYSDYYLIDNAAGNIVELIHKLEKEIMDKVPNY
jgi:prolyl-tRNA synthetase